MGVYVGPMGITIASLHEHGSIYLRGMKGLGWPMILLHMHGSNMLMGIWLHEPRVGHSIE